MSDAVDNSQEQEAIFLKIALSRREPSMPYTGFCHWCSAPIGEKAHFCDRDCRDDLEQHKRLNGGW